MTITVLATTATDWPLYNYLRYARIGSPANVSNASTLTLNSNDPTYDMFDRRMTLTGVGLSTNAFGDITGGTISSIKITGLSGSPTYYTMTFSTPLNAVTLWNGIVQYYASSGGNSGTLDSIFRSESYAFTGGTGDDFFEGSNAADTINGNAGDDVLIGLNGDDTINGGAGDDYIDGWLGSNTIDGGTGDDWIVTGTGLNVVSGGAGADFIDGDHTGIDILTFAKATSAVGVDLLAGVGTLGEALGDTYISIESVQGSKYNDQLIGSDNGETLSGELGNDTLIGHGGADSLLGGLGIDTVSYAYFVPTPAYFGGVYVDLAVSGPQKDMYSGVALQGAVGDILSGVENLIGTITHDQLYGDANANRIEGNGGDDLLEGRGDADTLVGSSGLGDFATYDGSPQTASSLVIDPITGTKFDGVTVSLAILGPQSSLGDASGDVFIGIDGFWGSQFNDRLIGDAKDNYFNGQNGDDLLIGGAGKDEMNGAGGIDTVSYAGSTSAVSVNLDLQAPSGGHAQGDYLIFVENVIGSAYGDTLLDDDKSNKLWGGGGNDSLTSFYGGADYLYGDAGNDSLFTFGGGTLNGGTGNDSLTGSIYGYSDWMFGDAGRDYISAGGGNDFLTGGTDRDRFAFQDNSGADRITDFKAGYWGDYLDLRAVSNLVFYQQLLGAMSQSGTDVIINLGLFSGESNHTITLENVSIAALKPINFVIN